MSVDMYRRQVASVRDALAKLSSLKARESQKAADAGKKSLAAGTAASKTKQLSTATSKLREANRYADLQAKHLVEVAKLEKKIAAEQKKLATAELRVESEEAKVLKKRNTEKQKMQEAQKRQLREVESSLKTHDSLHRETAARIDKLAALPEEIKVAFLRLIQRQPLTAGCCWMKRSVRFTKKFDFPIIVTRLSLSRDGRCVQETSCST